MSSFSEILLNDGWIWYFQPFQGFHRPLQYSATLPKSVYVYLFVSVIEMFEHSNTVGIILYVLFTIKLKVHLGKLFLLKYMSINIVGLCFAVLLSNIFYIHSTWFLKYYSSKFLQMFEEIMHYSLLVLPTELALNLPG